MNTRSSSRRDVLAALCATLAAPSILRASPIQDMSGMAFGTSWRIAGTDVGGLEPLRRAVSDLFAEVDLEMSPWRADSTLSRFNTSTTGRAASSELTHVTEAALALAQISEGAFDPTVGPLVARWGFGPITDGAVADWRGVSVTEGWLSKTDSDLTLDLCGIAKGRALDRAARLARDQGLTDALLDLGGEFRALGRHPEGRDWRIAVEHPVTGHPTDMVLHLPAGMAVATSGLGAQSYGRNGQLWGHIMDPATAHPVAGRLRSVTVLAKDAMTADGWATALFAAGDDGGPALARVQDISAIFLFEDGQTLRRTDTGGIREVLG